MPNIVVKLHFSSSMSRLSMSTLLLHCVRCIGLKILKNSAMKNISFRRGRLLFHSGKPFLKSFFKDKYCGFPKIILFFRILGALWDLQQIFSKRGLLLQKHAPHFLSCLHDILSPTYHPSRKIL